MSARASVPRRPVARPGPRVSAGYSKRVFACRLGSGKKLGSSMGCPFDEHCNESQAACGSGEMVSRLSTESCTGQVDNKALTSAFWCSAQRPFLIGAARFMCVWRWRCSPPRWCGGCNLFHSKMRAATFAPERLGEIRAKLVVLGNSGVLDAPFAFGFRRELTIPDLDRPVGVGLPKARRAKHSSPLRASRSASAKDFGTSSRSPQSAAPGIHRARGAFRRNPTPAVRHPRPAQLLDVVETSRRRGARSRAPRSARPAGPLSRLARRASAGRRATG